MDTFYGLANGAQVTSPAGYMYTLLYDYKITSDEGGVDQAVPSAPSTSPLYGTFDSHSISTLNGFLSVLDQNLNNSGGSSNFNWYYWTNVQYGPYAIVTGLWGPSTFKLKSYPAGSGSKRGMILVPKNGALRTASGEDPTAPVPSCSSTSMSTVTSGTCNPVMLGPLTTAANLRYTQGGTVYPILTIDFDNLAMSTLGSTNSLRYTMAYKDYTGTMKTYTTSADIPYSSWVSSPPTSFDVSGASSTVQYNQSTGHFTIYRAMKAGDSFSSQQTDVTVSG